MYNTRALTLVTTAEGTEWAHTCKMVALDGCSHHISRLHVVCEIYTRAAAHKDVNDIVSLRYGEDLVWWVVETLGLQLLENREWHIALQNHILPNDDEDVGNGNSTATGQGNTANTS